MSEFFLPKTFWFFLVIKRTFLPISNFDKRRDSSAEPVLEKHVLVKTEIEESE
jgi:hypothetical protein